MQPAPRPQRRVLLTVDARVVIRNLSLWNDHRAHARAHALHRLRKLMIISESNKRVPAGAAAARGRVAYIYRDRRDR